MLYNCCWSFCSSKLMFLCGLLPFLYQQFQFPPIFCTTAKAYDRKQKLCWAWRLTLQYSAKIWASPRDSKVFLGSVILFSFIKTSNTVVFPLSLTAPSYTMDLIAIIVGIFQHHTNSPQAKDCTNLVVCCFLLVSTGWPSSTALTEKIVLDFSKLYHPLYKKLRRLSVPP